ncbi:uncharacterized protein V6R79_020898 [Siganus canaliculatus]
MGGPVGAVVGAAVGTAAIAVGGAVLCYVVKKKDESSRKKDESSKNDSSRKKDDSSSGVSAVLYFIYTCYGDIMKVETTGASWQTSQQDGLGYYGVKASETMAETDAGRMERYRLMIKRVGRRKKIDPALIAAIISRESRAGNTLDDGWGDYRRAWGLMQVDVTEEGGRNIPVGAWDSEEHLDQATGELVKFINKIRNKFPGWTKEQVLKGGIAAYNMGDGNVHSYEDVDANTTGGDYSNDVVARAQWYKNNKNYRGLVFY